MDNLILPNEKKAKNFRHGYKTSGKYSPEYSIWVNMRSRCNNPKNNRYKTYGARGISVCPQWEEDFVNFLNDMGRRPSKKHSIDRINNDGNYEPSNCRWSTRKQQCRNRTSSKFLALNGEVKTSAEWCEETGVLPSTLSARLKNGWPVERALTEPVRGSASKDGKTPKPATIHKNLPF